VRRGRGPRALRAGAAPGVLNIVTRAGPKVVDPNLIKHEDVRAGDVGSWGGTKVGATIFTRPRPAAGKGGPVAMSGAKKIHGDHAPMEPGRGGWRAWWGIGRSG